MLVEAVLYLSVEINQGAVMVFELILSVFDVALRISDHFIELFNPFGDDSKNGWRFNKENPILNLKLSILGGILIDFPANNVFTVRLDLFSILLFLFGLIFQILIVNFPKSLFGQSLHLSLLNRDKYFLKNIAESFLKGLKFLISPIDHVLNGFHDLLGIIFTFFLSKTDLFGTTNLSD